MNSNLSDPAFWSRLQFGFTVTYHYLFPQLTMGLAWVLVYGNGARFGPPMKVQSSGSVLG
jgi:hypothetical protein